MGGRRLSLILYITGFALSQAATRVSVCRSCDSESPKGVGNDDCSQESGHIEICKDPQYFCLQRFRMTPSGMHITKGCATNSTCLDGWQTNPGQCSPLKTPDDEPTNLSVGRECTLCFLPTRLNSKEFDLVTYGPVSGTPDPTSRVTTPPPSQSRVTTPPPRQPTVASTARQTKQPTFPSSTRPPHPLTVGTPMVCADCNVDGSPARESCMDRSTICEGDTPLCMTSYVQDRYQHALIKRCASVQECTDLWWTSTSTNPECMSDNPDLDPHTWSSEVSGSCHYCCQTTDDMLQTSGWWCNHRPYPTKPYNLVNMTEYNILLHQATSAPRKPAKTTQPPYPTVASSNLECEVCRSDGPNGDRCWDKDVVRCPATAPYCMTTARFTGEHGLTSSVLKRCASESECHTWWQVTSPVAECFGDLIDTSLIGKFCGFCCNKSDVDGVPCNHPTRPDHVLDFNLTRPSQTSPPATVTTTDTATTKTSTAQKTTTQKTKKPTTPTPTTQLPTTTQKSTTQLPTSTQKSTTQLPTTTQKSTTQLPTTTQKSTTPILTTTQKSTTQFRTTLKRSTTYLPTTKQQSTKLPTSTAALSTKPTVLRDCVQCGDATNGKPCSNFDLLLTAASACPPGLAYCLNTIVQEGTSRAVYKKCAGLRECREKWYEQSSDSSTCVNFDPYKSLDTYFTCHYCCVEDNCNKPFMPDIDTLWHT